MKRLRVTSIVVCATATLIAGLRWSSPPTAEAAPRTAVITISGARVWPTKRSGKAWDMTTTDIPGFVAKRLDLCVGYPVFSVLRLVPIKNRPDPFLRVSSGLKLLKQTQHIQGTFLPLWHVSLPVRVGGPPPPPLELQVFDRDVQQHDLIGAVSLDVAKLARSPGVHLLRGKGALYDVTVHVHDPAAATAGRRVDVDLKRISLRAKPNKCDGSRWDAGVTGRPDLEALVLIPPQKRLRLPKTQDSLVASHSVRTRFSGRLGTGTAFRVIVVDRDLATTDPVGSMWVSIDQLEQAKKAGSLILQGDDYSGLDRVRIDFKVAAP